MKTESFSTTRSGGFTLIELLIVIALIAILAALAIPNLLSSRKAAREADAVSVMRSIITSQEMFRSRVMGGTTRYATLAELSNTPVGNYVLVYWPDPLQVGLRNEYQFTEVDPPTDAAWCIKASPTNPGISADRYFGGTEDGRIRVSNSDPTTRADIVAMPVLN